MISLPDRCSLHLNAGKKLLQYITYQIKSVSSDFLGPGISEFKIGLGIDLNNFVGLRNLNIACKFSTKSIYYLLLLLINFVPTLF
jgi:hypothetical protein